MDITTLVERTILGMWRGPGSNPRPGVSVVTKSMTPREGPCSRCQSLIATDYHFCGYCGQLMPSDGRREIRSYASAMQALDAFGARPEPIELLGKAN